MTLFSRGSEKTRYVPFSESGRKKRENISFAFKRDLVLIKPNKPLEKLIGAKLTGKTVSSLLARSDDVLRFSQIFDTPKLFPEQEFALLSAEGRAVPYIFVVKADYKDEVVKKIHVVGFPKPADDTGQKAIMDISSFNREANLFFERARKDGHPLSLIALFIRPFRNLLERTSVSGDQSFAIVFPMMQSVFPSSALVAKRAEDHFLVLLPDTPLSAAQQLERQLEKRLTERLAENQEPSFFLRLQSGISERLPEDTGIHTMLKRALLASEKES